MKKLVSLFLAAAVMCCCFYGCGKEEETNAKKDPGPVVLADLLNLSYDELVAKLGPYDTVESIHGVSGLEFLCLSGWIGFNLNFISGDTIPYSYYTTTILFGVNDDEIIGGISTGLNYSEVCAHEMFKDLPEPGEAETHADGSPSYDSKTELTVDYNGMKILVELTFDSLDGILRGGQLYLIEDEEDESSTGEDDLSLSAEESTQTKA